MYKVMGILVALALAKVAARKSAHATRTTSIVVRRVEARRSSSGKGVVKTHIIRQEDYTSSKHLLRVSWNDTPVTSQVKRILCRIRHAGNKYHL